MIVDASSSCAVSPELNFVAGRRSLLRSSLRIKIINLTAALPLIVDAVVLTRSEALLVLINGTLCDRFLDTTGADACVPEVSA